MDLKNKRVKLLEYELLYVSRPARMTKNAELH